jgi:pyruvate/2-oxoglutarate dehydrogenase complex dihydrolipoamide acyltransferase (E2) component
VTKWLKKPGDAVKKGEALFEMEVAGSIVIEMRAEVNGFMGPQLVPVKCLL